MTCRKVCRKVTLPGHGEYWLDAYEYSSGDRWDYLLTRDACNEDGSYRCGQDKARCGCAAFVGRSANADRIETRNGRLVIGYRSQLVEGWRAVKSESLSSIPCKVRWPKMGNQVFWARRSTSNAYSLCAVEHCDALGNRSSNAPCPGPGIPWEYYIYGDGLIARGGQGRDRCGDINELVLEDEAKPVVIDGETTVSVKERSDSHCHCDGPCHCGKGNPHPLPPDMLGGQLPSDALASFNILKTMPFPAKVHLPGKGNFWLDKIATGYVLRTPQMCADDGKPLQSSDYHAHLWVEPIRQVCIAIKDSYHDLDKRIGHPNDLVAGWSEEKPAGPTYTKVYWPGHGNFWLEQWSQYEQTKPGFGFLYRAENCEKDGKTKTGTHYAFLSPGAGRISLNSSTSVVGERKDLREGWDDPENIKVHLPGHGDLWMERWPVDSKVHCPSQGRSYFYRLTDCDREGRTFRSVNFVASIEAGSSDIRDDKQNKIAETKDLQFGWKGESKEEKPPMNPQYTQVNVPGYGNSWRQEYSKTGRGPNAGFFYFYKPQDCDSTGNPLNQYSFYAVIRPDRPNDVLDATKAGRPKIADAMSIGIGWLAAAPTNPVFSQVYWPGHGILHFAISAEAPLVALCGFKDDLRGASTLTMNEFKERVTCPECRKKLAPSVPAATVPAPLSRSYRKVNLPGRGDFWVEEHSDGYCFLYNPERCDAAGHPNPGMSTQFYAVVRSTGPSRVCLAGKGETIADKKDLQDGWLLKWEFESGCWRPVRTVLHTRIEEGKPLPKRVLDRVVGAAGWLVETIAASVSKSTNIRSSVMMKKIAAVLFLVPLLLHAGAWYRDSIIGLDKAAGSFVLDVVFPPPPPPAGPLAQAVIDALAAKEWVVSEDKDHGFALRSVGAPSAGSARIIAVYQDGIVHVGDVEIKELTKAERKEIRAKASAIRDRLVASALAPDVPVVAKTFDAKTFDAKEVISFLKSK